MEVKKKCVYGLADASLKWYGRVKSFLLQNKGKISVADPAVFYWHNGTELLGIICVHVHDFLWAGVADFENGIVDNLRMTFKIGKEETERFKYIGLGINQCEDDIIIDQESYINHLKPIDVSPDIKDSPLTDKERDLLQSKIGQLLWISSQTRPDISYSTCQLATRLKSGTVKDLLEVNKVIQQLKSYCLRLRYVKLGKDKDLKIIVFTDGAHGNLVDGGSQGDYFVFLVGENGKCALISWQSRRIRRVVKSSLAAETLSMSDGIDGAIFVNALLSEIYFGNTRSLPIEFITDNQSLVDALKSSKYASKSTKGDQKRMDAMGKY